MRHSLRNKLGLLACIAALASTGCSHRSLEAEVKEEGVATPYEQGKADGFFAIRDVGPLAMGETVRADVTRELHAFRVQSFGGTAISVDLSAERGDPYLAIEGPLDGSGDAIVPGEGAVFATNDDSGGSYNSHLDVVLSEPGVYRVIAGTYRTLGLGKSAQATELNLTASCTEACTRQEITLQTLLTQLRDSGKLEPFVAQARGQIAQLVPDAAAQALLNSQLDTIMASPTFAGLERFPMLPLRQFDAFRLALAGFNSEAPAADQVVNGSLSDLLGGCQADRSNPADVSAALPGIGNGHFPDLTLSACQAAHSASLAKVLTSLSVGNGSSVTYEGDIIETPGDLLRALMRNGHTVEVRNERSYANFLSITAGSINVRWPGWLDTGVVLDNGENLVVPMGHSQVTWHISGPDVDARVMFYLGTSGAAFFGQTSVRPAWTGLAAKDVTSNASVVTQGGIDDHAIAMADASALYLRRSRTERATVAQGMPADGYGYVGVCNDSVAAVEYLVDGTITGFPLVRARALDDAERLNDGLDDVLRILPHDADVAAETNDALTRILLMTPHSLDSSLIVDDALRAQLVRAQTMLNDGAQ